MRHPFQVSIVGTNGSSIETEIVVAKRGTLVKAQEQGQALAKAIGTFNRDGVPQVIITDLRTDTELPLASADTDIAPR